MTRIAVVDGSSEGCGGRSERALHLTKRASAASTCLLLASASSSSLAQRFRAKDERKRLLKLSVRKLKDIDDPETLLCRSVLINNTVRRLQNEIREEKAAKRSGYSSGRSYSPSPYSYFNIERVYRQEVERVNAAAAAASGAQACVRQPCYAGCMCASAAMEAVTATSTGSPTSSSSSSSDGEEEDMTEAQPHSKQLESAEDDEEDIQSASALMKKKAASVDKRSKSVLDEEECELLLGEVCMPPRMTPPQMIAGLDDEDDMDMAPVQKATTTSSREGSVLWTDDLDASPAWDEAVEESVPEQTQELSPAGDKHVTADSSCSDHVAADISCATTPSSDADVMDDDEELWNEISSSRWEWSVGDWTSSASASSSASDSAMPSAAQWSPSLLNDAHVLDSQQHQQLQQTYSYVPHSASSHQQHSISSYEPTTHFPSESDPCGGNLFSCGQTSMLSEMQPAVFGSGLLASLET